MTWGDCSDKIGCVFAYEAKAKNVNFALHD